MSVWYNLSGIETDGEKDLVLIHLHGGRNYPHDSVKTWFFYDASKYQKFTNWAQHCLLWGVIYWIQFPVTEQNLCSNFGANPFIFH